MSEPGPKTTGRLGTVWWVALAVFGLVLALEGGLRGDLRHRLVALAIGVACCVPLGIARVFGARGRRVVMRGALVCVSGALALGLAELLVRALDLRAFKPEVLVDDAVLGHRLLPERGEVDGWGFRNPRVPEHADVVCIGDSQTYGVSVAAAAAWPSALARRTGLAVYNAGLGGYGPLQYLALFERALELEPEAVVVALYLGNDLADAYTFAGLEQWAEFREEGVDYIAPEGRKPDPRSANLALAIVDGAMAGSRVLNTIGETAKRRLKQTAALDRVYWGEDDAPEYTRAPLETRFTPDYRFGVLDLELPGIRDGLRITELVLARLVARAREAGVRLELLVLPTKERCYAALMQARGEALPPALVRLARAEVRVVNALRAAATQLGVELIDPAPALVAALEADRAMWPPGPDGHFNEAGNDLLAEVVGGTLSVPR